MANFRFCISLFCFITTLSSSRLIGGMPLQENVDVNDGAIPPRQPEPANSGSMFPSGMPAPPPGAVNDGAFEQKLPQSANPGSMFPSGMPPPPPGAINDGVLQQKQPQSANSGSMFPSGMPPPPPGAFNDGAVPIKQTQPTNPGSMFSSGVPPPPPGALNDGAVPPKQPLSANPGSMFPSGMPPPPPGAFNDDAVPPKQPELPNSGSVFPSGMPPPPPGAYNDGVVPVKQTQPTNPGSMFPSGMPPPPPGAVNDGAQTTIQLEKQYQTVPLSNHPSSLLGQTQGSNSPANSPTDAVAEPNYLTGFQTPNNAAPPMGQEVPIVNPSQQYHDVNNQTAWGNPTGNKPDDSSRNIDPNNPNVAAPVNPDTVSQTDASKPAGGTESVVHSETQTTLGEASPNEQGVGGNPSQPEDAVPDDKSFEESMVIVEEEGRESSDYSFMNAFFDSESEDESDYFAMNALDSYSNSDYDFAGEEDQTEMTINFGVSSSDTFGEMESSFYSNLDWILSDGSESYENSDIDSAFEVVQEVNLNEEHNWGDDWKSNNQEHASPDVAGGLDDDMQPGSMLILYCIPAIILTVLILLAWRNYRGRIKVVTVSPAEKNYDWRANSRSREQLEPMLARGTDEEGY